MATHARRAVVRQPITERCHRWTPPWKGQLCRRLACGHWQAEPSGGRAHLAESAVCKTCNPTWKARRHP